MSTPARIPTENQQKSATLKAAIRWVHLRDGRRAVVEAFGDKQAIDDTWETTDLEGFRKFLWERYNSTPGAA